MFRVYTGPAQADTLVDDQEYISSKSVQLLHTVFSHIDITSTSNPISAWWPFIMVPV